MIPFVRKRFGAVWTWRIWLFGVTLGPEVWEVHVGPLLLWFDPEGMHDPQENQQ